MAGSSDPNAFYSRVSAIIIACTAILTLSFVGILAIISGETGATTRRLPWYLVLGAVAFVATIVLLEGSGATGREIIVTSSITAIWSFVLIGLAVEGIRYTLLFPEEVFVSQLVLYFLAAALLATGIAYWALHHWREFTGRAPNQL